MRQLFKIYTLIGLFFFCSLIKCFPQYRPLLKDNAQWYIYHYFESSCNETFQIIGDSILNGKTYKKIFANPYCAWNTDQFNLVREDTITKKVYLLHDTTDYLMYDFNMVVGDTIKYNQLFECTIAPLILDSITDSIINPLSDQYLYTSINPLKVYYFNATGNWQPTVWVEGLGSLAGFFSPCDIWAGGMNGGSLLCHYDENSIRDFHYIYIEEPSPCNGYVGIDEFQKDKCFYIYPNPSNDKITLEIKQGVNIHGALLSIYDIQNKLLKQVRPVQNKTEINISMLENGIYILKLFVDNKITVTKLLKE